MKRITVLDLLNILQFEVLSGNEGLLNLVSGVYISDMLSDVMANAREENIWITLHTHKNIVAVAELKNISAIIIVNNRKPDEDTKQMSNIHKIPILSTSYNTFYAAGKLFQFFEKYR